MTKKTSKKDLAEQVDPRAPLDSAALLAASRPVLAKLEADLLERVKASPAVTAALDARYQAEKTNQRTAESFAGWTNALATQVAAAWLLSCVFVRTLEDRGLLKQRRLAGPGSEDSQRQFFALAPSLTERDYLLAVFRELSHHQAAKDLFDAHHSLVWKLSPSAEVAKELLTLFRAPNATAPALRFGQPSTRFLGDLYQDLSEDVRKRYALLQTPDFVEKYILDHTLDPAIARFGLDDTTLIDPTCGSGHFLLGAFERLFEHRLRAEPGIDARIAATKALGSVYGADINPYAVAIARFRLTLSFLEKAGYAKLSDAPSLPLHLVVADSLRINPQHPQQELWQYAGAASAAWLGDVFALEDERAAKDVLGRQFAAVVGNPPYITVKDAALREVYRAMYPSCHRSYSLSVPFCERIFQLARPRGYTGQITANSFMKREFGKVLIEEYLPTVNLDRIVNTSGAYIPGHGTPTVLLFGTNEPPQGVELHAVLAKRGEPSTPEDPSQGLVWRGIVERGDELAFENEYISVARVTRETLRKHPWSLGGGGASELKELLEERASSELSESAESIGYSVITGEDNCLVAPRHALVRARIAAEHLARNVIGEEVRDWWISDGDAVIWPNRVTGERLPVADIPDVLRGLWPYRAVLRDRRAFGTPVEKKGIPWWSLREVYSARMQTPLTITFADVATHNHFVLDRGGKVFKQTAPIIKLPAAASEEDHLALLAYLNSSTVCFWLKQTCMNKGGSGIGRGIQDEAWEGRYQFDVSKVGTLPLVRHSDLLGLGKRLDDLARRRGSLGPGRVLAVASFETAEGLQELLVAEANAERELLEEMVAVQEDIDWAVYEQAGLIQGGSVPASHRMPPGLRAFEHRLLHETPQTQWFSRNHYADPRTMSEVPQDIVERLRWMREVPEISLIEQPEYKRRWTTRDHDAEARQAAHHTLASSLERSLAGLEVVSRHFLVQQVLSPTRARAVASLLGSDAEKAVAGVLADESVGFVAATRFTEAGLAKHAEWNHVWEAQRVEDRGGAEVTTVPPRYDKTDFLDNTTWTLRGKLDVPKERFISYAGCESDQDGEPVYGWAGWDHLQRAQALGAMYLKRKDGEGWTKDRLAPMLAGLLELIPWVKQWHNEPSAEYSGQRMGDYFEQFLDGECRQHGLTHDDLRAWRPPKKTRAASKKTRPTKSPEQTGDNDAPRAKKPRAKAKRSTPTMLVTDTEAE